ncbi:MAG: ATP-binding domain-containing protein, partial [Geodermatophilaceae bacterium]|nr:ATP-binding domain-containing protein [Geodermatophilaceae bacterium]
DQGQLTTLASALNAGSAEDVLAALRETDSAVRWIEVDDEQPIPEHAVAALRTRVLDLAGDLLPAARSGDAVAAVAALERHRLLCAHRRGPRGVRFWTAQVRQWLADLDAEIPRGFADRYAGLPLIVTANDYENQLWNGDTAVVVARGDDLVAAFSRGASPLEVPIGRVGHAVPMHAITVHRSQGSEFDEVTVLLPVASSPLATREMLYTAVTRARRQVTLIGSEAAVRSCVARQAQRATGLGRRLQP